MFHVRLSCRSKKGRKTSVRICTARKSLRVAAAANILEAVWFHIRNSDLMSCNACQEQHLLKRCLSDGQKCAGTNTDSAHSGGYSILNGREIISPDLALVSYIMAFMDTMGHSQFRFLHSISPQSKRKKSSPKGELYNSSTLPLITCRWASLMLVYISAA